MQAEEAAPYAVAMKRAMLNRSFILFLIIMTSAQLS